jgi:transposase
MEISSSTLPAVAAEHATMFVALELSKSNWLVALHSPVADKVSLRRFVGGDVAGLLALIARKQTQAEARLGRTIRVLSCYEDVNQALALIVALTGGRPGLRLRSRAARRR